MNGKQVFTILKEVLLAALIGAVFSLLALALAAIFVKNFALPQTAVTAVNWSVKCVAAFLGSAIAVKGERALFKGVGAGLLFVFVTLALFAIVGGGARLDGFFVLELLVCGILGGTGALLGAKLRKA